MDVQQQQWKEAADALWAAAPFDYVQAVRLVAEIAQQNEKGFLQQAAAQALPGLRRAAIKKADAMTKAMARRRFGAMRDALHTLAAPRFGRRRSADEAPDPDAEHRQMLGLPTGRRLLGPEINQAYKRAAKKAHPDTGGSERAFHELSAARDALLKQR